MDKAPDAFRIISEVADDLDVPQHVLRFWESRFPQIRPMKRGGGRRYYRPEDVGLLKGIRHLLYSEGYTIRGVQRILREQGVGFVQTVWQEAAQPPHEAAEPEAEADESDGASGRGRGLLGLLPSFRRDESDATDADASEEDELDAVDGKAVDEAETPDAGGRREPRFNDPAPPTHAADARPAPALSREQTLQLQMALDGLGECRRLLGEALKGN